MPQKHSHVIVRLLILALSTYAAVTADAGEVIREEPGNKTAIVFVHGLFGDPVGTWTAKSKTSPEAYWPLLVADDRRFDGSNIYTAEYRTRMWERGPDVEQTVQQLHWRLQPILARHEQVVFVCHSLGGIVVREYLLQFVVPREKVPMIYFFGTPSQGAELAAWAKLVSPNAQLRQLAGGNRSYLDKLGDRWVNGGYAAVVKSFCVYEDPNHFLNVVDPVSAKFGCNAGIFPILENHVNIVKPRNADAEPHRALATAYREIIHHGAPPPIPEPRPVVVVASTPGEFWERFMAEFNHKRPRPPHGSGASAACLDGKPVIVFSVTPVEGATHYIVHRNGRETFHTQEPTYIDRDVVPDMPYTYFAQACDADGCGPALPYKTGDVAASRCTNEPPVCASIEAKLTMNHVELSARVSDPDRDRVGVLWNFGDGRQLSGGVSLGHTYAAPGTYTVSASVSDGQGGTAICQRQITVRGEPLTLEAAEETWLAEEIAQPRSWGVIATPTAGPDTTRFLFRADLPPKYGKPVGYRWNFNDNGTPGGEWSARSNSPEISHVFTIYQDVSRESVRLEVTFEDGRVVQTGGTSVIVRRIPRRDPIVSTAIRQ